MILLFLCLRGSLAPKLVLNLVYGKRVSLEHLILPTLRVLVETTGRHNTQVYTVMEMELRSSYNRAMEGKQFNFQAKSKQIKSGLLTVLSENRSLSKVREHFQTKSKPWA